MNYKIKITETVGSASITTEVETDDLHFAKFCITEDDHVQGVNINNQCDTFHREDILEVLENQRYDLGGVENWIFKPTDLGSSGIVVMKNV